MVRILLSVLLMLIGQGPALAESSSPAAFVVNAELVGRDRVIGTSLIRQGAELPVRIMTPLLDGDVVFIRDPRSRIEIEGDDGDVVVVDARTMRLDIRGRIDTGDSAWAMLAAIAGVIGGSTGDMPPENMVSRGGSPMVPLSIRGTNLLPTGRHELWLPWTGGTAPFTITLLAQDRESWLPGGLRIGRRRSSCRQTCMAASA